jgi:hypothetical protein
MVMIYADYFLLMKINKQVFDDGDMGYRMIGRAP